MINKTKKTVRYIFNKAVFFIIVLLVLVSTGFSIYLDVSNDYSATTAYADKNETKRENNKNIVVIKTFRECLVILSTTFGASLLIGILITKKDKNDVFKDVIANDLIVNNDILDLISSDNKERILSYLDSSDYKTYPNNDDYIDMINHIKEKSKKLSNSIYYTDMSTSINCKINDDYIEKEITREMHLRSFEKSYKLKKFVIDTHSCEKISGKESYEKKELYLISSNQSQNLINKVESIPAKNNDREQKESNYNKKITNVFKYNLNLTSDKDTILKYKYITRVPIHDKTYTSRLKYPAKKYTFDFAINSDEQHLIFSQAFGFKNDASNSSVLPGKNNIHYSFDEWLFECDGVAVSFE